MIDVSINIEVAPLFVIEIRDKLLKGAVNRFQPVGWELRHPPSLLRGLSMGTVEFCL
jgi:hypothetical protein